MPTTSEDSIGPYPSDLKQRISCKEAPLLNQDEAELFFKLHSSLMCFVNERLEIVPGIRNPSEFRSLSADSRLKARNALLDNMNLLDMFVDLNPFEFSGEELNIVLSWKHQVAGKFFVFRNLKKYTVFLAEKAPVAYGVVALTDPFEDLIGFDIPVWAETVLLPFKDQIIYDGLLCRYNVFFGGGRRPRLPERNLRGEDRPRLVIALPGQTPNIANRKPGKKGQPKPSKEAGQKTLKGNV